jgi:hypothetical protein
VATGDSLQVFTSRISYSGPDRLDVTRKSGTDGLFLAPSWSILRPALEARKRADAVMAECSRLIKAEKDSEGPTFDPFEYQRTADDIVGESWRAYVSRYLAEMRESYRRHRAAWDTLLARERVVLVCYCVDPEQCHRYLLRSRILPALGAVDAGEVRT